MTTPTQPEYLGTFCPILSHAVLRPEVLKPEEKQMLIPLGGDIASAAKAATGDTAREAEYIGCQGPTCAFFLRGEGRCAIPLLTQALGVMVGIKLQEAGINTNPQH